MRVHTRETLTFRAWTCPLPSSAFRTVSGLWTSRPSHKSSGPGTAASATTCKLISFWSRRPIRRRDAPVLSVERAMPWRQKHIARSVLIQEPSKITRAETRRHARGSARLRGAAASTHSSGWGARKREQKQADPRSPRTSLGAAPYPSAELK